MLKRAAGSRALLHLRHRSFHVRMDADLRIPVPQSGPVREQIVVGIEPDSQKLLIEVAGGMLRRCPG